MLGLVLAHTTACSEMTLASGSSSPEPSSSSSYSSPPPSHPRESAAAVLCELNDDDACRRRVQAERHHNETQELIGREAELDRMNQERMHEEELDQMRANARAAGLDPDKGKGWHCFAGEMRGKRLSECRRTWDDCADRLLQRERAGLVSKNRRCEKHAQAACFEFTRTLKEGQRLFCFDDVAMCEQLRNGVDPEGFVSPPTECTVSD